MDSTIFDTIVSYLRISFSVASCCGMFLAPLYLVPATLRDPLAHKRDRNKKIDYSILDISSLIALMAFSMAAVRFAFVDENSAGRAVGGMVFFAGLSFFVWWTSIHSLSRANVNSKTRLIILLGVTPIVWIVSFVLPGCICWSVIAIISQHASNGQVVLLLSMSAVGVAILYISRRYIRSVYLNIDPTTVKKNGELP